MIKFYTEQKPNNKNAYKLMEQWPLRLKAFIKALPMQVAGDVFEDVKKFAPSDIPSYPDMLDLAQFPEQQGWNIVGVVAPSGTTSHRLRSVDVQRTVLYVRPKVIRGLAVSVAAVILERNNPWTMDTLPYEPQRREATVVSRRVSEKDVRRIETERRQNIRDVVVELRRAGAQIRPKGKVLLERRVSRDLAFEVLRREKGIGGPGKAHWRPAVHAVYTQHFKNAMEKLGVWMSDPDNNKWKEDKNFPEEETSMIERVQEFQDRIVPG